MNPNLCRIVLRPRGPLEVFDLTMRLVRVNAGAFARLWVLVVLPPALALAVACWVLDGEPALVAAPIVMGPALQAPAMVLGGRLLFADQVRLRDVLLEVVRRSFALLLAWVQIGFWATVGCGVFSWLFAAPFAWTPQTALLERVDVGRGLRRSFNLAGSNLGIAIMSVVGWWALTAWGAVVGEAFGHAVVGTVLQLGQPFGSVFDGRVTPYVLAGILAVQPLYGVYHLLLYLDVRTRVEGWDLQVGLMAAAAGRTA